MKSPSKRSKTKTSKETLEDIFQELLKDIYWAEKHLVKALLKMAKACYNEDLREAFETHWEQTQVQVKRIEDCFEILGVRPVAKKCVAMEGLIHEGTEVIDKHEEGHARDAGLIAAAQKVEHYEISAYGTLRTMATVLGKVQCAALLEETKDEEAETDETLTGLAERINHLAAELQEEPVE